MSKVLHADRSQSAPYNENGWNASDINEHKNSINAAYDLLDARVEKVTGYSLVLDTLIAKLNNLPDSTGISGQIASAITSLKNEVLGGAAGAYDTLLEIENLLKAEDSEDLTTKTAILEAIGLKLAASTFASFLAEYETDMGTKVDKDGTKVLSELSFTALLKIAYDNALTDITLLQARINTLEGTTNYTLVTPLNLPNLVDWISSNDQVLADTVAVSSLLSSGLSGMIFSQGTVANQPSFQHEELGLWPAIRLSPATALDHLIGNDAAKAISNNRAALGFAFLLKRNATGANHTIFALSWLSTASTPTSTLIGYTYTDTGLSLTLRRNDTDTAVPISIPYDTDFVNGGVNRIVISMGIARNKFNVWINEVQKITEQDYNNTAGSTGNTRAGNSHIVTMGCSGAIGNGAAIDLYQYVVQYSEFTPADRAIIASYFKYIQNIS